MTLVLNWSYFLIPTISSAHAAARRSPFTVVRYYQHKGQGGHAGPQLHLTHGDPSRIT